MAASLQLPPDVETWPARAGPRVRARASSRAASRSPAPSRRRSRCCSTCSSRSSRRRASSRIDTHAPLPGDVRALARGRGALRHEDRGVRGPARPVEDGLWETKPDLYLAIAKVEPLNRALARPRRWITGIRRDQSPTRADAPKLGWDEAHELWKANPLADWSDDDCWAYIRERGLPYNPLHDQGYDSIGDTHSTQPGAGARAAGPARSRLECGLHTVASTRLHVSGFVLWFTGLSAAGKTTIANIVAPELEQRGCRRRPPRRRRRAHAPVEGPRLLEGGPRHEHRAHRLGRLAARARRRGGGRLGDLAVRGDAPPRARARRAARAVRRGARGHAARGVRAPRPEGALRAGVRGRDRRVHRRLGAVRGAARSRAAARHVGPHADRVAPRSCSRGSRSSAWSSAEVRG